MRSLDVDTERKLTEYANATGRAVGGAWSIDILETKRGWHVTDMAEAANSWHEWPECPNTFWARAGLKPGPLERRSRCVAPAPPRYHLCVCSEG